MNKKSIRIFLPFILLIILLTLTGCENNTEITDNNDIDDDNFSTTSTTSFKWKYDDDRNVTDGIITLEIGDYVDYKSDSVSYTSTVEENGYGKNSFGDYNGTWQVLGVDEGTGELLIISSDTVGWIGLSGQIGYENCEQEMDKIGALYANGIGATDGRSLKIEDINKLTGYNPNNVGVYDLNQTGSGEKYGEGYTHVYGNEVTYSKKYSGKIISKGTLFTDYFSTDTYYSFTYYTGNNWETLITGESVTLKSDAYRYNVKTLKDKSPLTATELDISQEKYNILFGDDYEFGLSSTCINAVSCNAYFGFYKVSRISLYF